MSRIARNPLIGIRVFKVPSMKTAKLKKLIAETSVDDLEPRVIDEDAHEKFVRNAFAIRGKTAA